MGTEVTTTVLGFGCAGAFRLPSARERRRLLETAREVGIRHFDVARIYGLGRAEAELAPVLAVDRASLTVTTKFGLEPTMVGRVAGRMQAPVRAVLARRSGLQDRVASSGRDSNSGFVGRMLYTGAADPESARRALHRSLRALDTDRIEVFAVHDPKQTLVGEPDLLADCLDRMRADGQIGSWAVAGESSGQGSPAAALASRAPVVQRFDDVFVTPPIGGGALITFGAISRAMPRFTSYLRQDPRGTDFWSERLQADLADPATLPALLLRQAVRRNPKGVVVFSTTRPERIRAAAAAVAGAVSGPAGVAEGQALEEFAAAVTVRGGAVDDS